MLGIESPFFLTFSGFLIECLCMGCCLAFIIQLAYFNNLDIMVEVHNSASGGWHSVYDDEQLQAIDFGVSDGHGSGGDDKDVMEKSLFMENGLKEIEESLVSYEIGDMDDVSDEDLIKE